MAIKQKDSYGNEEITYDDYVNKWGSAPDIDVVDANGTTTRQVIWPVKSTTQDYIFLDAPIQLFLVSTSIQDGVGGTGALTVEVLYQNSLGIQETVILTTDGTTNVAFPKTSYGTFRCKVVTTGSSNTNVGDIKVVDGSANIYAIIKAGESQTQIAVQRVPDNYRGVIKAHIASYGRTSPSTNSADMRLRIRSVDGTVVTKWDPQISNLAPTNNREYCLGGIPVNPGEWVYWEAILVSADNTPIRASFDMEYYEI